MAGWKKCSISISLPALICRRIFETHSGISPAIENAFLTLTHIVFPNCFLNPNFFFALLCRIKIYGLLETRESSISLYDVFKALRYSIRSSGGTVKKSEWDIFPWFWKYSLLVFHRMIRNSFTIFWARI